MLCDSCKKNEANFHYTKIVNGMKKEYHLCQECARKFEEKGELEEFDFTSPLLSFPNILSGLMNYVGIPDSSQRKDTLTCKNCGMSFDEFKRTGLLGCSNCYSDFQKELYSVIKRVQGNTKHTGKVPGKSPKEASNERKVQSLKEQLLSAVTNEEYEKAAVIRDEIKKIEKGEGNNGKLDQ